MKDQNLCTNYLSSVAKELFESRVHLLKQLINISVTELFQYIFQELL